MKRGGRKLADERRALPLNSNGNRCNTGDAVETGPGDIPHANQIYRAVGPNYNNGFHLSEANELLASA